MSAYQTIIFDLGGVLLREAESNLHKAPDTNLQHALADLPGIKIFNRAFEFVALVGGHTYKTEWLLGTMSGQEIVECIQNNIDKPEFTHFFKSEAERNLIKHGISFVLLPEPLAELTEIIDEGFVFLKKCKARNIRVAIISNWDPLSFDTIQSKFPDFFVEFDRNLVVIPHMVGTLKPHAEIYEYTVKQLACAPTECFFVDDSTTNVEGAQKIGIKSVHHKNWQQTEQELIDLGLALI